MNAEENVTIHYTYIPGERAPRDVTAVLIPESVTRIGYRSFSHCSLLRTVIIPPSVTAIGDNAFAKCTSLTSITIPSSVVMIGYYAFSDCTSLKSISIPSVKVIGKGLFRGCVSLKCVNIPSSVTSMAALSFSFCSSLTNITIPSSVTTIDQNTFRNCSSLASINISLSSDMPCLAITKLRRDKNYLINPNVGTLLQLLSNKARCNPKEHLYECAPHQSLSLGKQNLLSCDLLKTNFVQKCVKDNDKLKNFNCIGLYINWGFVCSQKNTQGRFPVFTAIDQHFDSNVLSHLLAGHGAAVHDVDPVTGLEAFMLAAVGPESSLESIYKLLEYHPAAIIPYS